MHTSVHAVKLVYPLREVIFPQVETADFPQLVGKNRIMPLLTETFDHLWAKLSLRDVAKTEGGKLK